INYKLNLGSREVVAPALKSGQIDLYPGYAATDLEYYNNKAGEATGDAVATTAKLNSHLQPLGLVALTPSQAVDQNAFAVTKATQAKYNLTKLSDLAPIANQLTMGAGPECPTRPYCIPGLEKTYGIKFKAFKALDTDGPLTRAAFANGTIQVGLVFSSDGDLNQLGLVVLKDDKQLEAADNVVPIMRQTVATDNVKKVLDNIDAKLTTADLVTMNAQVSLNHQDADAVAKAYLQQHNFFS
ncbi:MAG TPA: ABC transporter substrate-binding protein, partial [Candidatus Eisenbacteria bacterium]|nr:ABC transporter substrate-binding protein [Candidatus Eisenbacteria bacterium]